MDEPRDIPSILARLGSAPWTQEQVANLLAYQECPYVHPFTCAHRDEHHVQLWGDLGTLVPTVRGWICISCDYTQQWAHAHMLDGRALRIAQDGPDTIP